MDVTIAITLAPDLWAHGHPWVLVVCVAMLWLFWLRHTVRSIVLRLAISLPTLLQGWAHSQQQVRQRLMCRLYRFNRRWRQIKVQRALVRQWSSLQQCIQRDIIQYPSIQQAVEQHIAVFEQDYRAALAMPQPSQAWNEVLERLAQIKMVYAQDRVVADMLQHVQHSIETQQRHALAAYRKESRQHQRILHWMMPHWRKLNQSVARLGNSLDQVIHQAKQMDAYWQQYQACQSHQQRPVWTLMPSMLLQCVLSSIGLVLALALVLLNQQGLLYYAQPGILDVLTGSASTKDGTVSLAAGVMHSDTAVLGVSWGMTLIVVLLGGLLSEAMRLTHLLPSISHHTEAWRKRLAWGCISALFGCACWQAVWISVAVLSDQGEYATHLWQLLAIGSGFLAWILPWLCVLIWVPIEAWGVSVMALSAYLLVMLLTLGINLCHSLAWLSHQGCRLLWLIYKLLIVIPCVVQGAYMTIAAWLRVR